MAYVLGVWLKLLTFLSPGCKLLWHNVYRVAGVLPPSFHSCHSALPSLIKAYRIQDKARNVGFDWEDRRDIWKKVKEEISEFEAEVENMDKDKAEAEFGDVMFSLINAARLYKINPDNALERTNQKFIRRFNYLEEHTIKEGINLKDMTLEEMDAIWDEAKKKGL